MEREVTKIYKGEKMKNRQKYKTRASHGRKADRQTDKSLPIGKQTGYYRAKMAPQPPQ